MGAAKSRSHNACAKSHALGKSTQRLQSSDGYFLLSFKGDKIWVVNMEAAELNLLNVIIKKHCRIVKEGWEKNLTYFFKITSEGKHKLIQLVADTLLSLYQNGWYPLSPVDLGLKKCNKRFSGPQATIYFKRKSDSNKIEPYGSRFSIQSKLGSTRDLENSCICLETYGQNFLGFHEASNTLIHDIINNLQNDYAEGVEGVSIGVASVIEDYVKELPHVLPSVPGLINEKYIQLGGNPWSSDDSISRETLEMSIIAALTKEGYKLRMEITMDSSNRVFFFIKDVESNSGEVLIPSMAKLKLGEYERPTVVRSKSSFFRHYKGRTTRPRKRTKASFREKETGEDQEEKNRQKPGFGQLAWWQQASTDMSSDFEDESLYF